MIYTNHFTRFFFRGKQTISQNMKLHYIYKYKYIFDSVNTVFQIRVYK